jgi:DNA-binding NarL/FixJ family response regulator
VLQLVVDGLNNPEIADKLGVSRATARTHVSHILAKLGVTNRAEAITTAFRHKLVS